MSTTVSRSTTHAERIEELIRAHREDVARLRTEFPDPGAALSTFVRERFDLAALVPAGVAFDEVNGLGTEAEIDLDAW